MFSLRRLHCHFCGTRSQYARSSGLNDFQCTSCEAVNYLDRKGNIIDTPASAVAQQQQQQIAAREQSPPFQTFTQQLPETLEHQQSQAFCSTCQLNQHLYMEALGNYLPDEDDPQYQEYEDALPQYTAGLEKRYPQVCKRCAPLAQRKINRADHYAGTYNIQRRANETARRGLGGRDDWWKWSMRRALGGVETLMYASLILQVAWHIYGILVARTQHIQGDLEDAESAFDPTRRECLQDALRLRFSQACFTSLGSYLPRAFLMSTILVWYNPGLKAWYHHTHRIESVTGQTEHFCMQLLMLTIRAVAWYQLSNAAATKNMTAQQLMASHAFVAFFMLAVQWLSDRAIKTVRFKIRQKVMPRPDEHDVLGVDAGPEADEYERQASSIPPSQLFAREQLDRVRPFPINNLAPTSAARDGQSQMPSPPLSDETDDEAGDPMEIDVYPITRSQIPGAAIDRTFKTRQSQKRPAQQSPRSLFNHGATQGAGWSGMRDSIFGIREDLTAETEAKRKAEEERAKLKFQPSVEPSPFRGRLPAAPMSMERKLRNPVTQLAFKETPVSKQQDFMQQMRAGIAKGKMFGGSSITPVLQLQHKQKHNQQMPAGFTALGLNDGDSDFSPVKNSGRSLADSSRGGLELKPSTWNLPQDFQQQATGLEDMFGGNNFRIKDEPEFAAQARSPEERKRKIDGLKIAAGVAVFAVVVGVFGWNVDAVRKAVCLWLVARMEDLRF
ncbi:hypothetical protein LTR78_008269 [Recurvomyces mirabilis]|uniref:Ima1 N-terminal domain-containing protein n=1 Tax=Recurvomyces mirabilis TaxID=574656 RepID=A0AAE0TUY4_9PEZI|nr:hypothetical protein LTR78_008269 [Recurvomyces mirabilis]KAK5156554.1 hypothetical protein LTS14_004766 [Recurvomyces mirabilis]